MRITTVLASIALIVAVMYTIERGQTRRNREKPSGTGMRARSSDTSQPSFKPGEVIVQSRRGLIDEARRAIRNIIGSELELISPAAEERGELLLGHLPPEKNIDTAITQIDALRSVTFAQRNYIYTIAQTTPNDPEYTQGRLWGMYSDDKPSPIGPPCCTTNPYGCQAEKAWAVGHCGSRNVYVGILDEGLQIEHPDLAANIWTNLGETGPDANGREKATNGIDDDGDGLIDDVHGWDFYHNDNSVYDGGVIGVADRHGTHVAGTVGGVGNNGQGVVGVNWYVTMIPTKFIGPDNGTTDKVVPAIDYLVRLKRDKRLNIVAINASWGGDGYDLCLLEAIKRAAREQILFVAGAGNGDALQQGVNNDNIAFYPACYSTLANTVSQGGTPGVSYDSVISVAAIGKKGGIASFSNYGVTTVDLAAPGVAIQSTWPNSTYETQDGTSMATAHVTGAVALYASTHPGANAETIKKAILDTVTATPSLKLKTVTGGRLNVAGF